MSSKKDEFITREEAKGEFVTKLELEEKLRDERHERKNELSKTKFFLEDKIDDNNKQLSEIAKSTSVMSEVLTELKKNYEEQKHDLNHHTDKEMEKYDQIIHEVRKSNDKRNEEDKEALRERMEIEKKYVGIRNLGIGAAGIISILATIGFFSS